MARAQQSGVSALAVWMIIFVALWLTTTVFLVILYTGQEDLKNQHDEAVAQRKRAISDSEMRSISVARQGNERDTIVGLMNQELGQAIEVATGVPEDNAVAVRTKRDELLATIRSDGQLPQARRMVDTPLLDAARTIYDQYKSLREQLNEADSRIADLEDQVNSLAEDNSQQKADFDARVAEATEQITQIEQDRDRYRSERDQAVAELEREFEQRRAQYEADLNDARGERQSAEAKLAQLRDRFTAQQDKFGKLQIAPEQLATARQPDGTILTAVPGDDVVYIDLGADDRLLLGMQFSVYSRDTGIPPDGRGKARIEIVSISEKSAECRIDQIAAHEVILDGDLIANPVYDRNRSLTFLVVGQFDLDYDGRPDPDGAATIEALVEKWGGDVTDDLTAMTDFVVVGSAPPKPKAVGQATADEASQIEHVRRVHERYINTLDTAKSLSVPVLPQNVFLHFLGYAGTPLTR